MLDCDLQRTWRRDAATLGEVGRALCDQSIPRTDVWLPTRLAEQAVVAWERSDDEGPMPPETLEQRLQRGRAATLGLIGLAITNHGRWQDDGVVVPLNPALIGQAVDAADAPTSDGAT